MKIEYSMEGIKFEVPSAWSVREIDGLIEIVDEQGTGALHLSIFRRTKADVLSELDAQLLVDNFASNSGLVPEVSVIFKKQPTEVRAIGSFRPIQPTHETPLYWLVGCVIWADIAVRASYCTDSLGSNNIELATQIIDSIHSEDGQLNA